MGSPFSPDGQAVRFRPLVYWSVAPMSYQRNTAVLRQGHQPFAVGRQGKAERNLQRRLGAGVTGRGSDFTNRSRRRIDPPDLDAAGFGDRCDERTLIGFHERHAAVNRVRREVAERLGRALADPVKPEQSAFVDGSEQRSGIGEGEAGDLVVDAGQARLQQAGGGVGDPDRALVVVVGRGQEKAIGGIGDDGAFLGELAVGDIELAAARGQRLGYDIAQDVLVVIEITPELGGGEGVAGERDAAAEIGLILPDRLFGALQDRAVLAFDRLALPLLGTPALVFRALTLGFRLFAGGVGAVAFAAGFVTGLVGYGLGGERLGARAFRVVPLVDGDRGGNAERQDEHDGDDADQPLPPGGAGALAALLEEAHGGVELAAIAFGPGPGRLGALAPAERVLQVRRGPQRGLALLPQFGGLLQPAVHFGGREFVARPVLEPVPLADQAFMGDVDDGVVAEIALGRREKAPVLTPERVDDGGQLAARSFGDAQELAESGGTADVGIAAGPLGQPAEQNFRDLAVAVGGQAVEDLVGMLRQGAGQPADLFVVLKRDLGRLRVAAMGPAPHHHHGVLHEAQLVGHAHHVVEQPIAGFCRDRAAGDPGGLLDRFAQLVPGHARGQELAGIDHFRQTVEPRTLAEIVGAHGHDDEDGHVALPGAAEQQVDERRGLVPVVLVGEPEDLFELVDQNEDAVFQAGPGRFQEVGERQGSAFEGGAGEADIVLLRRQVQRLQQAGGEDVERMVARPHLDDAPGAARFVQEAEVERRQEAGLDQRGLAAARRAGDGKEPVQTQPVDHLVDMALAAEEDVGLFAQERPETGIGRELHHAAPPFIWPHMVLMVSLSMPSRHLKTRMPGSEKPRSGVSSGAASTTASSLTGFSRRRAYLL